MGCRVSSVKGKASSVVKCRVRSVECGVQCVKCRVRRVEGGDKCKVWSIKMCKGERVECGV